MPEVTTDQIATIYKKLDMLWITLMSIIDKSFSDQELRSLLNELDDLNKKYQGEEVEEPVVLEEPKEVEA